MLVKDWHSSLRLSEHEVRGEGQRDCEGETSGEGMIDAAGEGTRDGELLGEKTGELSPILMVAPLATLSPPEEQRRRAAPRSLCAAGLRWYGPHSA